MSDALLAATKAVPSLTRFKHTNEFGQVVESERPKPTTKAEVTKYYVCNIPTASMHRADGKRLPFINGFLATDLLWDQHYLDLEIAEDHANIRYATDEEIHAAKMRADPAGTMREQLEPQLRQELQAQLETEILAKLVAGGTISAEAAAQLTPTLDDQNKIEGTLTTAQKLARLRGAPGHTGATAVMESGRPLINPVSTANLGGAQAGSGGGNGGTSGPGGE